jgi:hypothetical protein
MKRIFIAISFLTGVVIQSAGQDYPTMADEYCNCFGKLKDSMDVEFQNTLMKVATDSNVKKAFESALNGMTADKRMRFATQLEFIGRSMETEDNEAGKCGAALDAKYKKYNDTAEKEKTFNTKMIAELNKKNECRFLASLITFALAFGEED